MRFLNFNGVKPLTADQQVIISAIRNDPGLNEKDYLVILWQDDNRGYSSVEVAKCRRNKNFLSVSLFFAENKLILIPMLWQKKGVRVILGSINDVPLSRVADTLIQMLH